MRGACMALPSLRMGPYMCIRSYSLHVASMGFRQQTTWPFFPSSQDYFELGVILTRKRLFTQATKNLEKAKKVWDGEENELAQVRGDSTEMK